jgi:hypothetical protein
MDSHEQAQGYPALVQDLTIDSCPLITPSNPNPPSFYARILPLGASIVWGVGSSNGNGFRKPLRDGLRQEGWKVNMVGSQNHGPMVDSVSLSPLANNPPSNNASLTPKTGRRSSFGRPHRPDSHRSRPVDQISAQHHCDQRRDERLHAKLGRRKHRRSLRSHA